MEERKREDGMEGFLSSNRAGTGIHAGSPAPLDCHRELKSNLTANNYCFQHFDNESQFKNML